MTNQPITDESPASALFPEYDALYELIANEVESLTDEQLNWTSDDYGWAEWSIRVQLSHMASLIYRWLILRWGDVTFPDGEHGVEDVDGLAASPFDRRMDETKYYDLPVILSKLQEGIDLTRRVLSERNVGFLRAHSVTVTLNESWGLMIKAHPTAVTPTEDPSTVNMQMEGSIRHVYFEEITHLFNIQRLKRAQGLSTVSDLPRVGYWVLDGWDVSEAD
ncbi:MAG: hypothetical protein J4G14_02735 [Dehalococcoidia bacterium]|nr:hypothetical protein [Dehalococcoidia bacterium]